MKKYLHCNEWCSIQNQISSSLGLVSNNKIQNAAVGSKEFVSRLSLTNTLQFHEGCVNAVSFSQSGDLIASGSDDLKICVWNWRKTDCKPVQSFNSGHHGNVFQSKFMPFTNDTVIVSCGRDGQVRVSYLSATREVNLSSKKLVQHRGSAHKLSVLNTSANLFKSAGEDGVVYNFDLRENEPSQKMTVTNDKGKRIELYSIDTNPAKEYEFAVSGRDPWARVFDERMVPEGKDATVEKYCPDHLKEPDESSFYPPNITCLMFNYNGTELLCSYNDEEIYLFDTTENTKKNFTHTYKGHRNSDTVKGVNFFGPQSEYIVSGSDCGHVFMWDKETEQVVNLMKGDDDVVNVLEPHPSTCILATSGLEHNIKVWSPVGDQFNPEKELDKVIEENKVAKEEVTRHGNSRDLLQMMALMSQMQRRRRRHLRAMRRAANPDADEEGGGGGGDDNEGSGSDVSSTDGDDTDSDDNDEDDEDSDLSSSRCVTS